MSPDDVDQRAKLDAWCGAVGPVVVDASRSSPHAFGAVDRLVLIGWNVHLGAGDVVQLLEDVRADRISGVAADAPIALLLQESFRSGGQVPAFADGAPVPPRIAPQGASPRRDILQIAAAVGLNVFYLPTMRNGRGTAPETPEDRGLAILSSLPLSNLEAIELPLERQRRPAAAATIRLGTSSAESLTLRLVNVHLESRNGARRLWLGSPHARDRQGTALTTAVETSVSTVLEGDLNTWANHEPVLDRLRRVFMPCTDGRPTFSGGLHLDWFFSRLPNGWSLRCWRLDRKYGSDHYPIVGVVEKSRPS
jgi:endonuclease/exonuclease/phosphatase family metal-dependent hydrolase